jgi:hypothetical protein
LRISCGNKIKREVNKHASRRKRRGRERKKTGTSCFFTLHIFVGWVKVLLQSRNVGPSIKVKKKITAKKS